MTVSKMFGDKKRVRAEIISWIRHILDRNKWNGSDLAKKANLSPSTILRFMNDPKHEFIPTFSTLRKIANGSGFPIPRSIVEVMDDHPDNFSQQQPPATHDESGRGRKVRRGFSSGGDVVKVRHVSALPDALQNKSADEVFVHCPKSLEGDDTAFAFYVPDSSHEPWIKAGTLAYATRRRDPIEGDWVLVTLQSGKSSLRMAKKITERGLSLSAAAISSETIKFGDLKDISILHSIEFM